MQLLAHLCGVLLAHLRGCRVQLSAHLCVQKSIKEMQGKVSLGSGEVPGLHTVSLLRC